MSDAQHRAVTAHGDGDSLLFAGVAVVAYVAFGVFAFLHDGSTSTPVAGAQDEAAHIAVAVSNDIAPTDAAREAERIIAGETGDPSTTTPDTAGEVRLTRSLGGAPARVGDPGPGAVTAPVGTAAASSARDVPGAHLNLQFVVKFDREEGLRWRDRFLENPNEARAAFEAMGRRDAAFAGLRLVSMNYSGLATVEFVGAPPSAPAAREALSDDIVRRLGAASGVDYAEPNLVGWRETNE